MNKWQPIETAPKKRLRWDRPAYEIIVTDGISIYIAHWNGRHWDEGVYPIENVTHWMPLPDLPSE